MKVKRLMIKNVGLIADTSINLDKPLILFYGDLMQGKTTLLNSVKWVFGGGYPADIIRHGQQEASVSLEFDNGSITREWYRNREGKIADRPIVYILDGKPVKRPVDEIKKLLNPYLLDNEYLKKMGETERKNYFAQLFAIDTSELDKEYAKLESDAKDLRATIKAYGVIDTTEVKLVDVQSAKDELDRISTEHSQRVSEHAALCKSIQDEYLASVRASDAENAAIVDFNKKIDEVSNNMAQNETEIKRLQEKVAKQSDWLAANPKRTTVVTAFAPVLPAAPERPDTSALETQISEAKADEVRYEQYQKNLTRAAEKAADEKRLVDMEARQREIKRAKLAKLKEVDTGGISGLSFDENGHFVYDNTQAGMLSTSQIMKLSSELSSLYPQGFGLELIDRAESLGKSIFTFVERAQREEKSILATIVGEKPAAVPEHIGVFVVEKGQLTIGK